MLPMARFVLYSTQQCEMKVILPNISKYDQLADGKWPRWEDLYIYLSPIVILATVHLLRVSQYSAIDIREKTVTYH